MSAWDGKGFYLSSHTDQTKALIRVKLKQLAGKQSRVLISCLDLQTFKSLKLLLLHCE